MLAHLKKWWVAYGGIAIATVHNAWPPMREYICSHPKVSGTVFLGIILAALLKSSPMAPQNP